MNLCLVYARTPEEGPILRANALDCRLYRFGASTLAVSHDLADLRQPESCFNAGLFPPSHIVHFRAAPSQILVVSYGSTTFL